MGYRVHSAVYSTPSRSKVSIYKSRDSETMSHRINVRSIVEQQFRYLPSRNSYIMAAIFEAFLYGIYTVLIAICTFVLVKRKGKTHLPMLISAIVMFAIATADMGLTIHSVLHHISPNMVIPDPFVELFPRVLLYVTNNVIADAVVIYRCYIVWGGRKIVIIVPCILLVAGTVCGYVLQGNPSPHLRIFGPIFMWITFALNILVTILTAARVWWASRTPRAILGRKVARKYHIALAMIIESGIIYPTYMLLDLVMNALLLDTGLVQVVGIVPTLIIVQVGLGRELQDLNDDVKSAVRFVNHESTSESIATVNMQFSSSESKASSFLHKSLQSQSPSS